MEITLRRALRPLGAITASMQFPRLAVALFLVAAVMLLGAAWDAVHRAGDPADASTMERAQASTMGQALRRTGPIPTDPIGFDGAVRAVATDVQGLARDALSLHPREAAGHVLSLVTLPLRLWAADPWTLVVGASMVVLCLGLFGTALSRMAAVHIATGAQMTVVDGLVFGGRAWLRATLALLAPPVSVALVALVLLVPAVLLRIPALDVIAGLFYGLALAGGLAASIVALGATIMWPMLVPAVACDNIDGVEALQRVLAYLVRRPMQVAGMIVVALVGLAIGYLVVAGVATTTLNFTNGCMRAFDPPTAAATPGGFDLFALDRALAAAPAGAGPFDGSIAEPMHGTAAVAAALLRFWQRLLLAFVVAWVVSYVFTAATHVYLAAREASDGQDPSEIWLPGHVRGTGVR